MGGVIADEDPLLAKARNRALTLFDGGGRQD
jgi:hypothetical protein